MENNRTCLNDAIPPQMTPNLGLCVFFNWLWYNRCSVLSRVVCLNWLSGNFNNDGIDVALTPGPLTDHKAICIKIKGSTFKARTAQSAHWKLDTSFIQNDEKKNKLKYMIPFFFLVQKRKIEFELVGFNDKKTDFRWARLHWWWQFNSFLDLYKVFGAMEQQFILQSVSVNVAVVIIWSQPFKLGLKMVIVLLNDERHFPQLWSW